MALKDPDLEPLRERREWLAGLADMRGAALRRRDGGAATAVQCSLSPTRVPSLLRPALPHAAPGPAPAGGINEQTYVRLRSEAKAPFRLTRIIFLGGLAAGAGLGLFIITGRLLAALQGA